MAAETTRILLPHGHHKDAPPVWGVHELVEGRAVILMRPNWICPLLGPFNPQEDAAAVYAATHGPGWPFNEEGNDTLINILTARTPAQIQQIRGVYNGDMMHDLRGSASGNFERILVALAESPAEFDAAELHSAMAGLGTDDATLIEILSTRNNGLIEAIKEIYTTKYGATLENDIRGDTSRDFKRVLLSLCEGNRNENWMPNSSDATRAGEDARMLFNAGEKRWGTDDDKFIEILTKRSPQELAAASAAYRTLSPQTLEQAIHKETSGHFRTTLMALVDPPKFFAELLHKALHSWSTNDKALIRLLVRMDPALLCATKLQYQALHGKTLTAEIEKETSGELRRVLRRLMATHQASYNAVLIREYCSGRWSTNKEGVNRVLLSWCQTTNERVATAIAFETEYGVILADYLASELGSHQAKFLMAVCVSRGQLDAIALRYALTGMTTDEDTISETLTSSTPDQLIETKEAYTALYSATLDGDIHNITAIAGDMRHWKECVLQLAVHPRSSGAGLEPGKAQEVAHEFFAAGEKKMMGCDEAAFIRIATHHSPAELKHVDQAYVEHHGHSVAVAIEKNCGSHFRTVMDGCFFPHALTAKLIHDAMGIVTNDDRKLIHLIARRNKQEMAYIGQAFENLYKRDMFQYIESGLSGPYKTALMAYIR